MPAASASRRWSSAGCPSLALSGVTSIRTSAGRAWIGGGRPPSGRDGCERQVSRSSPASSTPKPCWAVRMAVTLKSNEYRSRRTLSLASSRRANALPTWPNPMRAIRRGLSLAPTTRSTRKVYYGFTASSSETYTRHCASGSSAGRPQAKFDAAAMPCTSLPPARRYTRESATRPGGLVILLTLVDLEGLDDVALLEVLVAVDADTALQPGRHLFDVVLEALQAADRTLEEQLVGARDLGHRPAGDLPLLA